jgi:hypothetical protein
MDFLMYHASKTAQKIQESIAAFARYSPCLRVFRPDISINRKKKLFNVSRAMAGIGCHESHFKPEGILTTSKKAVMAGSDISSPVLASQLIADGTGVPSDPAPGYYSHLAASWRALHEHVEMSIWQLIYRICYENALGT